jgi:hypothetical protein
MLTNQPYAAFMNLIENSLNLLYLYLAHLATTSSASSAAPLIGFASATMTLAKTMLYILTEYYCTGTGCHASHNDLAPTLLLYVLPNG